MRLSREALEKVLKENLQGARKQQIHQAAKDIMALEEGWEEIRVFLDAEGKIQFDPPLEEDDLVKVFVARPRP